MSNSTMSQPGLHQQIKYGLWPQLINRCVNVKLNHVSTRLTSTGYTPLWIASAWGHADVVKLLLDHDAEVNKAANDGHTPLWAARHPAVKEMLKAAGGKEYK
ncbi:unnamed protein product [Meganyctiphanes norvegica]|uniref:Myotrophin n=1 Tax=Meganyctiphanes norvegica TaxID=48144 RepID=A0AAV2SC95_MEGNR